MNLIRLLTFVLTTLLVVSCVGVIEDTNRSKTSAQNDKIKVNFTGIVDGEAISHSKINIRFHKATGGSGYLAYHAFVNGMPQPIETLLDSEATTDAEGLVNMQLNNLDFNREYIISVKVYDFDRELYDSNKAKLSLWTMNTYVPEFDGIVSVSNVAGSAGMTSLKVVWNQATVANITGSSAFDPQHSVSGYNVYYSTNQAELEQVLALENQHFPNLSSYPSTKIASISDAETTDYTITGLSSDTTYYCAVRARQSSTPPKYEKNSVTQSATTYGEQPVEFGGLLSAMTPTDVTGFSQINVTWNICSGCGEYRFYVKPQNVDIGGINPISDSAYLVKTITNTALTSATLADGAKILPNTNYKVYAVACKDSDCGWTGTSFDPLKIQGQYNSQSVKTTPPVAKFSEANPDNIITSISQPAGTLGLEQLIVSWVPVDTTSGYYSKLRIYHVKNKNGNIATTTGNSNLVLLSNTPIATFGEPYIDPAATSLEANNSPTSIKIVNLERDQEYCFLVLPWITGNGLTSSQELTLSTGYWPTVQCATPEYVAPDFGTTSLAPSCSQRNNGTAIELSWTPPEVMNIFTDYEIYYRDNTSNFEFTGANGAWLNGLGTYRQDAIYPKVSYTETDVLLTNLTPSTEYHFGINTYFLPQGEITPIRSIPALNMATVTCTTGAATVTHGGWTAIYSIGPKINGQTGAVVKESLGETFRDPYPDPTNGASNGIVRLSWLDFEITGTGLYVHDLPGSTNGYAVYRLAITNDTDATAALDPDYVKWTDPAFATKLRFNLVSNGSGKFAYTSDAINADTSKPNLIPYNHNTVTSGEYSYEFVDFPPASGTIYYYLVKASLNNVETDFADPTHPENVLKVIVPFNNEAFIHRWMANLSICSEYGRGIGRTCTDTQGRCSDRENDYRCEFLGMGNVYEDGDYYIDRQSHIIMDRFEVGCNMSFDKCTISGTNNTLCKYPGGITNVNTPFSPGVDEPAVALDSTSSTCYYRANAAATWTWTDSYPLSTINSAPGSGLGKVIYSNNAYLPPGGYLKQSTENAICKSFDGRQFYAGGDTYYKKLISKKDFAIASSWDEKKINNGLYINIETAANAIALTSYKDCNTYSLATKSGATALNLLYANTSYCASTTTFCPFKSGSDGNYSSESCVSKFGVQDMVGNMAESSSDQFNYNIATPAYNGLQSTVDSSHHYMEKIAVTSYNFNVNNWISSAPYINAVLAIPLTCTNTYNSDPTVLPSNQCQADDKTSRALFNYGKSTSYNWGYGGANSVHRFTSGGEFTGAATLYPSRYWYWQITDAEVGNSTIGFRCVYEVP